MESSKVKKVDNRRPYPVRLGDRCYVRFLTPALIRRELRRRTDFERWESYNLATHPKSW